MMLGLTLFACGVTGAGSALAAGDATQKSAPACDVSPAYTVPSSGPITVADVMGVRDIMGVAPSPDHRWLAVSLARDEPTKNRQCISWFVIDLTSKTVVPRVVGNGGEMRLSRNDDRPVIRGQGGKIYSFPQWSPDGQWFAYLKQENGQTQIWRSFLAGGAPEQITNAKGSVTDFVIDPQSGQIIYRTLEGYDPAAAVSQAEYDNGFLFDDRFFPSLSLYPLPTAKTLKWQTWEMSIATWAPVLATTTSSERFTQLMPTGGSRLWAGDTSWDGAFDPTAARHGDSIAQFKRIGDALRPTLQVGKPDGEMTICKAEACTGPMANAPWWNTDGSISFTRKEGANREYSVIYKWMPGSSTVTQILHTTDYIYDCWTGPQTPICLEESELQPGRLITLDPKTARRTAFFDPNPGFGDRFKGQVKRLRWTTKESGGAYGTLVLPPDYDPKKEYPMVVLPYAVKGFARTSFGNAFPILPMADAGMVVLELSTGKDNYRDMTNDPKRTMTPTEWADLYRLGVESTEGGIAAVRASGVKVGKIGAGSWSYGAQTIDYWLVHTPVDLSVVSTNGFSWEPSTYYGYMDDGTRAKFLPIGLTPPGNYTKLGTWCEVATGINAANFDVPWLMNSPDSEFAASTANLLPQRERGRAVELYIMPDETHYFTQSAHAYAAAQRNLAWFSFWLTGKVAPGLISTEQQDRWAAMKTAYDKRQMKDQVPSHEVVNTCPR